MGIYGDAEKYTEVVVNNYLWFSLILAKLHIWICKPSATQIDIDCRTGDGYASRVHSYSLLMFYH